MTHKIIRYEITNEYQEQVEIETRGDLQYMPAECVMAIYGSFEKTGNGTVLYSATIEREADGTILHNYDSEYADDYRALVAGRVEVAY